MTNLPPLNDAAQIEPLKDEGWFFIIDDKRALHIRTHEIEHHIRMGNIHSQMLAHSDSMPDPVPAGEIPALVALTPFGIPDKAEQKKAKNAVQNSVAMFVCLILIILMAGGRLTGGCYSLISGGAVLFALIYIPLRFKILRRIPHPYKWMGFVGGFGMIGLLLLGGAIVLACGGALK